MAELAKGMCVCVCVRARLQSSLFGSSCVLNY